MGVRALVFVDRSLDRAFVSLSGIPLGGSVSGVAWFQEDGESVVVESELYKALGRRGVSIVSAGTKQDFSYVWVKIQLPIGLGVHRMILPRVVQTL